MNATKSFLKTAAAIAIVAAFGAANAQQEEKTQIQKPMSSAAPMNKSVEANKPNDALRTMQKPSSGMMPAPKTGPTKNVDDSVAQTQKPSDGVTGVQKAGESASMPHQDLKKQKHKQMKPKKSDTTQ